MKKLISLLLLASALPLYAPDVQFDLGDFTTATTLLRLKTVKVEPQTTVFANNTNLIITSDRRFYNVGTNVSFIITNMQNGNYRISLWGNTYTSIFRIAVPDTNGTLNAGELLIGGDPNLLTENGDPILTE